MGTVNQVIKVLLCLDWTIKPAIESLIINQFIGSKTPFNVVTFPKETLEDRSKTGSYEITARYIRGKAVEEKADIIILQNEYFSFSQDKSYNPINIQGEIEKLNEKYENNIRVLIIKPPQKKADKYLIGMIKFVEKFVTSVNETTRKRNLKNRKRHNDATNIYYGQQC